MYRLCVKVENKKKNLVKISLVISHFFRNFAVAKTRRVIAMTPYKSCKTNRKVNVLDS